MVRKLTFRARKEAWAGMWRGTSQTIFSSFFFGMSRDVAFGHRESDMMKYSYLDTKIPQNDNGLLLSR
jgi:hypothetical protein